MLGAFEYLVHVGAFYYINHTYIILWSLIALFLPMYSSNTLIIEANPWRPISETIKALEIQTSMLFTILLCFFFYYLLKRAAAEFIIP